jgi:hypothetical protein
MKKLMFSLLLLLVVGNAIAQDIQTKIKPVIEEGKQIFQIEMANRMAPKLFKAKYKGKEKASEHISYLESNSVRSVFFTKGEKPKVLGSILFDASFEEDNIMSEFTERELSVKEIEISKLKSAASKMLQDASSFNALPNTSFSIVPLMPNGENKVFILSIPKEEGTVLFGNDYVLNFDNKFNLTSKEALHRTLASVTYTPGAGRENDQKSSHTHVATNGDLVTSTDIATLLLFQKPTGWSQHTFIAENYIFFWSYVSNELKAIPKGPAKTN